MLIVALATTWHVERASATTYHADDGASLQVAVASANSSSGSSTIELTASAFRPTSTLSISGDVTIAGPSSSPGARLDGSAVLPFPSDLLIVQAHAKLTLSNVELFSAGGEGLPAIEDFGSLDIENSTIANNLGPGVLAEPQATVVVRNATISGGRNSGVVNQGTASLFSTTVAFNKLGGVENKGTLDLTNTIVADNGLGGGSDCEGKATSSDHSLDSDGSCGVAFSKVDPKLAELAANGGPTPTDALEASSPAIAAGDDAKCAAEDQRYFARPAGRCDIGAYQSGAVAGGSAPGTPGGGAGSAPSSGSSGLVLVGVSGHGSLRGARRSRITFSVRAEAGHADDRLLYTDGARHLSLKDLVVKSLAFNAARGTATISGTAVEERGRRRARVTIVLVNHSGHRSLRIGLSTGYHESGSLLAGSITFIRGVHRGS